MNEVLGRNTAEKSANLLAGALRRFVVNEVRCIRSEAKLEISEELRQSISPRVFEHRIMFPPKDPRRNADR